MTTPRSPGAGPGPVLVTGAAGFIGHHVSARLLREGTPVWGADDLNPYYDVRLKRARLALLRVHPGFRFVRCDLADARACEHLFARGGFRTVIHLAAQPGVRHSLENPRAYLASNLGGFLNVLEGCRRHGVEHLVFASSSSVYGGNTKVPFAVTDPVDHPVSLYAATKKADELMAHAYAHLFRLPTTGLRFFTVYGPWGRPDMAPLLFADAILEGRPITLFNGGRMRRDFTYVADVVEAVVRVARRPAAPSPDHDPASPRPDRSDAPYRIYNVGNAEPVELLRFVELLERALGRRAKRLEAPMQPGDVLATSADVTSFERDFGALPHTPLEDGLRELAGWYREYRGRVERSRRHAQALAVARSGSRRRDGRGAGGEVVTALRRRAARGYPAAS